MKSFSSDVNIKHKTECHTVRNHRGTAVAYERQRYACYGHKPDCHTYVFECMEKPHSRNAHTDIASKLVLCFSCCFDAAENHTHKNEGDDKAHYKTALFADNRENKIRVFFGQVTELGLYSVKKSLAEELTGAYRNFALHNVITVSVCRSLGGDKSVNPLLLNIC